jgi:hypothetical protein
VVFPIVLLFDRSGRLEEGQDVMPLDVVTRRVLEDLKKSVAMVAAEMRQV